MNLNVENFKIAIEKATFNFSSSAVQLILTKDKVESHMRTDDSTVIIKLNMDNSIIDGIGEHDTLELNFFEPQKSIIPLLNIIDDEESEVKIYDRKIIIQNDRQKSSINFCSPTVIPIYTNEAREVPYFFSLELNDDFVSYFKKIKKVCSRFKKIYFGVDNGFLFIETSDRQNSSSDKLSFDLCDGVDGEDIVLCFDSKRILDLMKIIEGEEERFIMSFSYLPEKEKGMIFVKSEDENERYYLFSKEL